MPNFSLRDLVRSSRWVSLALAGFILTVAQAHAANRVIKISAPASALPDAEISVPVAVSTDAGGGEQIGFFHADFSTDSGKTWTGFCYAENAGPSAKRNATFKTGPIGSKSIVRVRIAFRGGTQGDVDFNGTAIDWTGTWTQWKGPPAKFAVILIEVQ